MNNPTIADDPAKDPKYAEPAIDALRAQKDEVRLDRFLKVKIIVVSEQTL